MAFRLNDAPILERPRQRIEAPVSNRQWRAPDITSVGRVRLGKYGIGTNSVGRNGIGQAPIGQADIQVLDKGVGEGFHAEWRARNDGEQPGTARLVLRDGANRALVAGPDKILEPGEEATLELDYTPQPAELQGEPDEFIYQLELIPDVGEPTWASNWHLFVLSYMVAKSDARRGAERQRWEDALAAAGFTEQQIPFNEDWESALADRLSWKESVLSAGLNLGDVLFKPGWENALSRYIDKLEDKLKQEEADRKDKLKQEETDRKAKLKQDEADRKAKLRQDERDKQAKLDKYRLLMQELDREEKDKFERIRLEKVRQDRIRLQKARQDQILRDSIIATYAAAARQAAEPARLTFEESMEGPAAGRRVTTPSRAQIAAQAAARAESIRQTFEESMEAPEGRRRVTTPPTSTFAARQSELARQTFEESMEAPGALRVTRSRIVASMRVTRPKPTPRVAQYAAETKRLARGGFTSADYIF